MTSNNTDTVARPRWIVDLTENLLTPTETDMEDLCTLVRHVWSEVTGPITDQELAQRVADKTPPHELLGLYRAALHFAVDRIIEVDHDAAMNAVFGSAHE
jgi:hypothetical protein